jgi:UDPglucose 6-dehydrogenase
MYKNMNITVVGTGYVGLVTGACFAEVGFNVTCVDVNVHRIERLKQGISPIFEPGIEEFLTRNMNNGRLQFSNTLSKAIIDNSDVIFSAVGTPPDEDGSADLQYVLEVARTVGKNMSKYTLLVTKSTVPVGTARLVADAIQEELAKRGENIEFDVASNPEFLKEGDAINDFMKPDRIVVGLSSPRVEEIMGKLYNPFVANGYPLIFTDIASAEMIKYAANAMLATRISFMNDIANLCDLVGADVNMVRKGIGSDTRIGSKFLNAGIGYGGSCFPKDVKALIKTATQNNYSLDVLKAVETVNERQKLVLFNKLKAYFNSDLKGKTIALWGLSYKPNTDDMREAPSLVIIKELLKSGCKVQAYDPVAMEETKRRIGDVIHYYDNKNDALQNADALLLLTEWVDFNVLNFTVLKEKMKHYVVFDGRNIYNPTVFREQGFDYFGIGVV